MSLLRIYGSTIDHAASCEWALINEGRPAVTGAGLLRDLPQHRGRVQLVLPAAQVLITRARIPPGARRRVGSLLAFAVEEKTASDPDANQVSWLGDIGEEAVLAVTDRQALAAWHQALSAAGIRVDEVHCETLLLPVQKTEWSLAWDGCEGFIRTGEIEGQATDRGDRQMPPLTVRWLVEESRTRGTPPSAIVIYSEAPDILPDIVAWQQALGVDLRVGGRSNWRTASEAAGVSLIQPRQRLRIFAQAGKRLRPAAWILGAALTFHAVALVIAWSQLAADQRTLRAQMESQFRASFPNAIAVVDPALQMRRKLAEARHAAGLIDNSDFLPMIGQVAAAVQGLPVGAVRTVSYDSGRMTLELAASEDAAVQRIVARLMNAGLNVENMPPGGVRTGSTPITLTVHAS